ncbi:hypothetical protein MKW98_004547 [Papaver atlanticum]|uniref:Cathepsin propeptide inhibitor domain-containing protein n=1 Tax=Papaver atlanticum TaxID=357466 RepID=A0AAD4SQZ3_9MAGN|nr:hypothetical protein MKW98_004547 [Papaver atlanticum]
MFLCSEKRKLAEELRPDLKVTDDIVSSESKLHALYLKWLSYFDHHFDVEDEKAFKERFEIFKKTARHVNQWNKGGHLSTCGLNQFSDLTDEEYGYWSWKIYPKKANQVIAGFEVRTAAEISLESFLLRVEGDELARSISISSFGGSIRRESLSELFATTPPNSDGFQIPEEEVDEEELKCAAIERLPTYDRVRNSVLSHVMESGKIDRTEIDVTKLDFQDKKLLKDSIVKFVEELKSFSVDLEIESTGLELIVLKLKCDLRICRWRGMRLLQVEHFLLCSML